MITARKSWLGLALTLLAGAEGLSTVAYRDPVGIPTLCFGYTRGVEMGDTATPEKCQQVLTDEAVAVGLQVSNAVTVPLTRGELAAYTLFTYNAGIGAFKGSTLLRKLNAGDHVAACNELPRWVYAHGVKLQGLIKRREKERQLCLSDLPSTNTGVADAR